METASSRFGVRRFRQENWLAYGVGTCVPGICKLIVGICYLLLDNLVVNMG